MRKKVLVVSFFAIILLFLMAFGFSHTWFAGSMMRDFAYAGDGLSVRFLLSLNPSLLDARDFLGERALHGAASGNHPEIARLLVEKGADINAPDEHGETPLDFAREGTEVHSYLKEQGAICWDESIYAAAARGELERVKTIIQEDPSWIRSETNNGDTALQRAVFSGNEEIILFLIDKGAVVDAPDWQGNVPLHCCVRYEQPEIASVLLENGANPNSADQHGWTPLHLAVAKGQAKVVKLLLHHGADPNLANKRGDTAIEIAQAGDQDIVYQILLEHGSTGKR